MLLNCGVGEDSWESLDCKEIQPVHSKGDGSWVFFGRIDVEAETPILWPPDAESWLIWTDPDAGKDEGRRRRGQQRMRCWMASPTQWTWVWVDSGSWWWTGRPCVLWFMEQQRVGHYWVTEVNWTHRTLLLLHAWPYDSVTLCHWIWITKESHWKWTWDMKVQGLDAACASVKFL